MTRIGVRDIVTALLGAAADVVFPGRRERTEDYDAVRKAWEPPVAGLVEPGDLTPTGGPDDSSLRHRRGHMRDLLA